MKSQWLLRATPVAILLVAGCESPVPSEDVPVPSATVPTRREAEATDRAFRAALDPEVLPSRSGRTAVASGTGGGGRRAVDRRRQEAGADLLASLDGDPRRAAALVEAMMKAVSEGPENDPCGRLYAAASVLDEAGEFGLGEEEFRRSCESHPPELRACLLGAGQMSAEQRRTCERIMPGFPTFGGFLPGDTEGEGDFEPTAAQRAARRQAQNGPRGEASAAGASR
ncbi:MAG: hypothetical protein AAF447_08060 [Myxococcota bacterium]